MSAALGAADIRHRVLAADGVGSSARRKMIGVAPEFSAASCKRRVAIRSSSRCGFENSMRTAPTPAAPAASSAAHRISRALREKTKMNSDGLTPKDGKPHAYALPVE